MRRRYLLIAVIAILAVAALTTSLVVARADQSNTLPSMTAADVLFKMATTDHSNLAVNGSVSWTNDLLGQSGLINTAQYGAAQSPLTGSGSGRFWYQNGKLRLESQGQGGDQIVIVNKDTHTAWVYDYAKNTATKYLLPTKSGTATTSPEPSPTGTFGPADIQKYIEQMATTANVTVAGQTTVAGQQAYILQLTPTATDTALGRVTVAIDGTTFVPLQLQVFPAGSDKATIAFGFDHVSYTSAGNDLFTFTPPAGTKVTTTDLAAQMAAHQPQGTQSGTGADQQQPGTHKEPKPLTAAEAQAKVGFSLAAPQGYSARSFQGAWVADQAQIKTQLEQMQKQMQQAQAGAAGGAQPAASPSPDATASGQPQGADTQTKIDFTKLPQQAVIEQYGTGFGGIWFAQVQGTAELDKLITKLPKQLAATQVAGHQAWTLTTPLGGVIVWKQGDLTMAAGGMVTSGDLQQFVAAVK